jgi:chromosomal replication initiator protein
MQRTKSFADFVSAPENRAALLALQGVAARLEGNSSPGVPNPVFLHGPTGTGKSHLMAALVRQTTDRSAAVVSILESGALDRAYSDPEPDDILRARDCDLFVLEDVQHLPPCWWERLVKVLDHRLAHDELLLFTANVGPQQLAYRGRRFPNRLASRLASGLVVALQPLKPAGRRLVLAQEAKRRQLPLGEEVLSWLAEHLPGGGRPMEGALNQLAQLARLRPEPLDLDTVARCLKDHAEAHRPTIERIAQRVGSFFCVQARQLQSHRRQRNILVPRQVGMYLARKLTGLPLEQIGAYFGGRDHTTVLHACRKVTASMAGDAVLSGAVRQLQAELV